MVGNDLTKMGAPVVGALRVVGGAKTTGTTLKNVQPRSLMESHPEVFRDAWSVREIAIDIKEYGETSGGQLAYQVERAFPSREA
jgi:hypothetical protein